MYIRYNNSPSHPLSPPPPPPKSKNPTAKEPCPPHEEEKSVKNPLHFLPKEIYNPKTHKFFGLFSAEDILIIGLILLVLDSGCDDDMILVLALLYILLSDIFDFGNILF